MDHTTLHVVTPDPDPTPEIEAVPCDGSYTCECAACLAEKAKLVKLGVRRTPPPLKRAA